MFYIKLTDKQIQLIKRMLPTCRMNAYQINDYQAILKSLDSPIKNIQIEENKKILDNPEILMDNPLEYKEIKSNNPVNYNNSFLKSPSDNIQKSFMSSIKDSITEEIEDDFEEETQEEIEETQEYIEEQIEDNIVEEIEETQETIAKPFSKSSIFSKFSNSTTSTNDIDDAGIFQVIDNRTKK